MAEVLDPKWTRVSSILSMIPTMVDGKWKFPMNDINQEVLARKASLGHAVHAAIEAHTRNEFHVVNDKERGYVDSFVKWADRVGVTWQHVERRFFYEPMNLTGCVDMIGKIQANGLYQGIDFKCTVSDDPVKWPLQAALYDFLLKANGIVLDKRWLFLQLDPNGDYPKVHEYEITKDLMQTAMSFFNAYSYLVKK